jgi:hypothetical protein
MQLAARVNHPTCDEVPFIGQEINGVTIGAIAIDILNRTLEDPRVPAEEWLSLPRLEHDTRGGLAERIDFAGCRWKRM